MIRRLLCILTVAIWMAAPAGAQVRDGDANEGGRSEVASEDTVRTREVALSADLLERTVENGERVNMLIGNVRLREDETHLSSMRAVEYPDRREILFTGEVLIAERGDTLRADTVLYNRTRKTGRASGSVRLSDGDVIVRAPSGLYFTRAKRAQFTEGVTLVDSTAVLSSRGGEYWSDEKRAEFYGDVELREERTYLEADSVTYFRETDVSVARGDVFIERMDTDETSADSLTRSLLFGDRAYNEDSTAYSRIEGDPLLIRLRRDSLGSPVDTLLIRAGLLESSRIDSLQRLVAVDSVQIWQDELAAVADSLVYDRVDADSADQIDLVRLFNGPIAWFQNNQVSGDTLRLNGRGRSIDSLFVDGSAFVARRDTTLDKIQQLQGLTLVAAFEDDSLETLIVGPQAQAINFRVNEDGAPAGAVRMSADRIVFRFDGDDVRRIEAIRSTEGTYYGEDLIPADLNLQGFVWVPERRPRKQALVRDVEIPVQRPGVASNRYYTEPVERTD